jgi:hypothetical protein
MTPEIAHTNLFPLGISLFMWVFCFKGVTCLLEVTVLFCRCNVSLLLFRCEITEFAHTVWHGSMLKAPSCGCESMYSLLFFHKNSPTQSASNEALYSSYAMIEYYDLKMPPHRMIAQQTCHLKTPKTKGA